MTLVSGVDEDRHVSCLSLAIATAARAASSMVGLVVSFASAMPALARISRPCSALVPSRRMTIGARNSTRRIASTIPLATSSPRVMPPKMLMKIDFTLWSKLITSSAAAITSALAPPPMSRKLDACAPDLVDDVERRHRQPGPVGDDPHRTLEPDVLQVVLAGELLALVELLRGAELVPLRMAEGGVVVEADLGVEGVHTAVRSQDQRVDLGEVAVALCEAAVELYEHVGDTIDGDVVDPGVDCRLAGCLEREPVDRVDVEHHDRVRDPRPPPTRSRRRPAHSASAGAAWRCDRA